MSTLRRPRLLAAAVAAIALALASAALWTPSAGAASDPRATAASTWLARELDRGGGTLPDPQGQAPDLGLTADAIVALTLAGETSAAGAASDAFFGRLGSYTSLDDLGPQFAGVRLAGPWAKTLLVTVVQGEETSAVGARAEEQLRSLMRPTGEQAGRFSDDNPYDTDASNGFGQATAVMALARTPGGAPTVAVDFLLAQQCPDGGFRLFYDATPSCRDASQSDSDNTAVTIEALLAVPPSPAVDAAVFRAVAWLRGLQDPATGAFAGTGPTDAPNANSTGLAAHALRAAGQQDAADRAAAWVAGLQLDAGDDAGAIAYDRAGRDAAVGGVIGDIERDQWRRATSQAVLALGLPPFVPLAERSPEASTTTTSSTTPSSTTSTSTPPPGDKEGKEKESGTGPAVLAETQSKAPISKVDASGKTLARTGFDVLELLGAGTASSATGAVMLLAARKRRS